jgi:hypothetical protein
MVGIGWSLEGGQQRWCVLDVKALDDSPGHGALLFIVEYTLCKLGRLQHDGNCHH